MYTRFALLQVWAVWATFAAIAWHRHRLAPVIERVPTAVWFIASGTGVAVLAATIPASDVSRVLFEPEKLLICALVFVFLFSGVTLLRRPLLALTGWLFVPLGQQALAAVAAHIVLLATFPLLPLESFTAPGGLALQAGMVIAVWLVALVTAWTIQQSRQPGVVHAMPAATARPSPKATSSSSPNS